MINLQKNLTSYDREALPLELPEVFGGIDNSKNKRDSISEIPLASDLFSSLGCLFLMRLLLSRASLCFDNRRGVLAEKGKMSRTIFLRKGDSLKNKGQNKVGNDANFPPYFLQKIV